MRKLIYILFLLPLLATAQYTPDLLMASIQQSAVPVVDNKITDQAGFYGSPTSTNVDWGAGLGTLTLNTNATYVRTGTTSLKLTDNVGTSANVFWWRTTPTLAPNGVTVTISFWSKAATDVQTGIAGNAPFTGAQDNFFGINDWQFHEHQFVSDGTNTRIYAYCNGSAPHTGTYDTYLDDIIITW